MKRKTRINGEINKAKKDNRPIKRAKNGYNMS